jgi:hypothetical protein
MRCLRRPRWCRSLIVPVNASSGANANANSRSNTTQNNASNGLTTLA